MPGEPPTSPRDMRVLGTRPRGPLTAASADPGPALSFAGPLPAVDLSACPAAVRFARHKRWVWMGLSTDEVLVTLAVVRTGYAATAFVLVHDLVTQALVVDRTWLAPRRCAEVSLDAHAAGVVARFGWLGSELTVNRTGARLDVRVVTRGLELRAQLDESRGPPGISAVAPLGSGAFNATEKRLLLDLGGVVELPGRRLVLDGGLGGYDYTAGLLPRHTRWRWACGMGKDRTGAPVGFNVVSGFVGEAECAAFDADGVHPLGEPEVTCDLEDPYAPWLVRGGGTDLVFTPGGVHRQRTRLGLLRSDFLQPTGTFDGILRASGRLVEVARLPGVVEHQDVLW